MTSRRCCGTHRKTGRETCSIGKKSVAWPSRASCVSVRTRGATRVCERVSTLPCCTMRSRARVRHSRRSSAGRRHSSVTRTVIAARRLMPQSKPLTKARCRLVAAGTYQPTIRSWCVESGSTKTWHELLRRFSRESPTGRASDRSLPTRHHACTYRSHVAPLVHYSARWAPSAWNHAATSWRNGPGSRSSSVSYPVLVGRVARNRPISASR